jgi:hypothetical protein
MMMIRQIGQTFEKGMIFGRAGRRKCENHTGVEAEIPGGAPDDAVRTVTENSRTLKFTSQGVEME